MMLTWRYVSPSSDTSSGEKSRIWNSFQSNGLLSFRMIFHIPYVSSTTLGVLSANLIWVHPLQVALKLSTFVIILAGKKYVKRIDALPLIHPMMLHGVVPNLGIPEYLAKRVPTKLRIQLGIVTVDIQWHWHGQDWLHCFDHVSVSMLKHSWPCGSFSTLVPASGIVESDAS
jgi:hypothetical protein